MVRKRTPTYGSKSEKRGRKEDRISKGCSAFISVMNKRRDGSGLGRSDAVDEMGVNPFLRKRDGSKDDDAGS